MVAQQRVVLSPAVPAEINHPGMSAAWFDAAVQRSFERELVVTATSLPGLYFMESSRDRGIVYRVNAHSCGCDGHAHAGRCYHRARAIFEDWSRDQEPEPPTPAAPSLDTVTLTNYASVPAVCRHCNGTGGFAWTEGERLERADCPQCHGTGRVRQRAEIVWPA